MLRFRVVVGAILFALVLVWPTLAHAPEDAEKPPVEKWQTDRALTVSPAAAPLPALKYRLFPSIMDRKEGNAVPIYLRLIYERNEDYRKRLTELPAKWNALPLSEIPLDEAREFLTEHRMNLRQLELGARRKTAEWNYTLDQGREAGGVMGVLMGDTAWMRNYSRLIALQARVQIADGDFTGATHTLETGLAFSQHLSEGGFLISDLVGVSSASIVVDIIPDFQAQPKAPNLYWALTTLPRPFIDLRKALELEHDFVELQFPEIADLDRARPEAEWNALLAKVRRESRMLAAGIGDGGDKDEHFPSPDDPAEKSPELPAARKYLVERSGMTKAAAAALPPVQALLLYFVGTYKDYRDDMFKNTYLPPSQALPAAEEALVRLGKAPWTESTVLPKVLSLSIAKTVQAPLRLDRKIAALRVIEAVRMHAAENDGQLPNRLSDVKVVPVPEDPWTGKPFEYVKDGATATLSSRIPGEPLERAGLRYRITIKR